MPKTVEEKYKKYTQIEHVLARPGMYIGELHNAIGNNWVVENSLIVNKQLTWNPGVYKIFDEIITNAADETQRNEAVKNIKVEINDGAISVFNDGAGIPIEIHKEYSIYIPELIFANLLSSSNYDDSEKRTVGGLNGLGAKLTNIYSKEFTIETASGGKKYTQTFKNNLSVIENPEISKSTKEYTKITFTPDYSKFGMSSLYDNDTYKILEKRVYDICAVTNKNVNVYFNGEKLKTKDFSQYIDLYIGNKKDAPRVYEEVSSRWAIGFALSPSETFQQISFVNGIATIDGGSHIDHVLYPIIKNLTEELQSKHKNLNIKPQYIKDHLFVFVKCLIENPTFSSQTKDKNTTRVSDFGSRCNISEETIKKISKLGFVDQLLAMAEAKEKKSLSKTDGKKINRITVEKLDDANKAGTTESDKCTLILTEGDSAKTTAISGLSVVGRDYYGVFPLRGKLLNTRTATFAQISKNEEINNIKKIIGLQTNHKYKSLKELRYGKILIMTDQDTDGFHIKSLLINFIDSGWPELLKNYVFVESLLTPIVKVNKRNSQLQFYNIPDYEEWKKTIGNEKWNIKYYKGLGTSTSTEAKEYFKSMKTVGYIAKNQNDSLAIELAFKKTEADARKQWILNSVQSFKSLDYKQKVISIEDLINQELVLFSIQDNIRSLPNLVDGLKPSQRKVLYATLKKNPTKSSEIKVSQLSGFVSEQTSYHHGETSLMDTIIGMAQNFTGSNNMNLLVPSGQFGTRLMGGKDASSPRYIFTYLSENINKLFHPADFNLLEYLDDDGQSIEPRFYVPKLPLLLINGSQGIGTGFSTTIPCFNPDDLKKELFNLVKDPNYEIQELTPWYNNFKGEIIKIDDNKWLSVGIYIIEENDVIITELPIGVWTEDYKLFLEKLEKDEKIHYFINESTDTEVNFRVKVKNSTMKEWGNSIEKNLKLTSNINAQNMHCFNEKGEIVKMHSPEEILWNFYKIRNNYNIKRKNYLEKILNKECKILQSKVRFIEMIISEKLIVFRKKKDEIIQQLNHYNFYKETNYDYLIEMNISSFTEEKIIELTKKMNDKEKEFNIIQKMTVQDMWTVDLN